MEIIRLENVTKDYTIGEVTTRALDNVSLQFANGEFTTLVGPSGSGKTTLLQIMGCLDLPDRGKVFIENRDVTGLKKNARADLRKYRKHTRGPKKPALKRVHNPRRPHVSVARVLAKRGKSRAP